MRPITAVVGSSVGVGVRVADSVGGGGGGGPSRQFIRTIKRPTIVARAVTRPIVPRKILQNSLLFDELLILELPPQTPTDAFQEKWLHYYSSSLILLTLKVYTQILQAVLTNLSQLCGLL
jgi:hypothetical protein